MGEGGGRIAGGGKRVDGDGRENTVKLLCVTTSGKQPPMQNTKTVLVKAV